ncbi:MAG: XTP/dITP diphosphatase [Elusimicrobiota bacterium]|jgi:XTP/dITP diphosphohydrolase|nr:XTP/dITP diphosphatase [Elusimicrobiota bacterium]
MKEFILATGNKDKIKEIKSALKDLNIKIIPLSDFKNFPKTIEDGLTLEYNAVKKAKEAAIFFNKWAIADDTGLEVDHLNGAPGVYSARYAGKNCSYDDNNNKLLKELESVKKDERKAKFRCVIAIANPAGDIKIAQGEIEGFIAAQKSGNGGFGYDPIFFIPQYNKTFAELSCEEKNKISHRGKALNEAKKILKEIE